MKKMTALFGYSDEYGFEKQVDQDNVGPRRNSNKFSAYSDRCRFTCRLVVTDLNSVLSIHKIWFIGLLILMLCDLNFFH